MCGLVGGFVVFGVVVGWDVGCVGVVGCVVDGGDYVCCVGVVVDGCGGLLM